MKKNIAHWLKQLLVALDQLLNVLSTPLSMNAWADETISSRAYRMGAAVPTPHRVWFTVSLVVDGIALLFGQRNHCFEAFESERLGRQLFPEARTINNRVEQ